MTLIVNANRGNKLIVVKVLYRDFYVGCDFWHFSETPTSDLKSMQTSWDVNQIKSNTNMWCSKNPSNSITESTYKIKKYCPILYLKPKLLPIGLSLFTFPRVTVPLTPSPYPFLVCHSHHLSCAALLVHPFHTVPLSPHSPF